MTASIMLYGVVVGLLLVPAALLADRAAALCRLPRRWGWAAVLLIAIALPIIGPWRVVDEPAPVTGADQVATGADVSVAWTVAAWGVGRGGAAVGTALSAVAPWAATIWLVSSAGSAAVYAAGFVVLAHRRRQWIRANVQGRLVLLAADTGPAVVGLASPVVVLPEWVERIDASSLAIILRHEEEHVAAKDPWFVHGAGFATVLMPWNPAVWWLAARLRLAVEFDCDARVLASRGGSPDEVARYGELLLSVATRQTATMPLAAPALIESSSSLSRRIAAMCAARGRFVRTRTTAAGIGAFVLLLGACRAPVPATSSEPPTGAVPAGPEATTDAPLVSGPDQSVRSSALPGSEPTSVESFEREPGGVPGSRVPIRGGEPPQVRRPGPGVTNPRVLREVQPGYTSAAMRAKVQGYVELEIVVGVDGLVKDARITKSLDKEFGLDDEALEAARKWQFAPGTVDGKPAPVAVTVVMSFTIH